MTGKKTLLEQPIPSVEPKSTSTTKSRLLRTPHFSPIPLSPTSAHSDAHVTPHASTSNSAVSLSAPNPDSQSPRPPSTPASHTSLTSPTYIAPRPLQVSPPSTKHVARARPYPMTAPVIVPNPYASPSTRPPFGTTPITRASTSVTSTTEASTGILQHHRSVPNVGSSSASRPVLKVVPPTSPLKNPNTQKSSTSRTNAGSSRSSNSSASKNATVPSTTASESKTTYKSGDTTQLSNSNGPTSYESFWSSMKSSTLGGSSTLATPSASSMFTPSSSAPSHSKTASNHKRPTYSKTPSPAVALPAVTNLGTTVTKGQSINKSPIISPPVTTVPTSSHNAAQTLALAMNLSMGLNTATTSTNPFALASYGTLPDNSTNLYGHYTGVPTPASTTPSVTPSSLTPAPNSAIPFGSLEQMPPFSSSGGIYTPFTGSYANLSANILPTGFAPMPITSSSSLLGSQSGTTSGIVPIPQSSSS